MHSIKLICVLAIIAGHSIFVNGQFGGFGSGFGNSGGFSNSNTNFQQNRGGSFAQIATFGTAQSNTNFQQQNSNGGFSNFGFNRGGIFRSDVRQEDGNVVERSSSNLRYASPYDVVSYQPHHAVPQTYPVPAPPVQCPHNLLVGCAPQVQTVPCASPPSYGSSY